MHKCCYYFGGASQQGRRFVSGFRVEALVRVSDSGFWGFWVQAFRFGCNFYIVFFGG